MATPELGEFEIMTSDRTIEDSNLASPSSWLRLPRRSAAEAGASFVTGLPRRSRAEASRLCFIISSALILMLMSDVISAEAPNLIGSWNVGISFPNGEQRYVRFDAQTDGKGALIVADPKSKVWGNANPSEAKWSRAEGNAITFAGPVEFMLGNVGRDAGTLTCRGKFETPDLITGDVEFSPLVGDGPSKHGTFRATRADPGGQ
jgi:hypothetical protein